MNHKHRTAFLTAIVVLVSLSALAQQQIAGEWASSEGTIQFTYRADGTVEGTYAYSNGRIRGRLEGQRFVGYWAQDGSSTRCSVAREGSLYWGPLILTFNADWTSFQGVWAYCDAEPTGPWTGSRTRKGVSVKELRFVELRSDEFIPVSELQHGQIFFVEALFNGVPTESAYTAELSWGDEATPIKLTPSSDPAVFRSESIRLEAPRPVGSER